ncbi:hypothetical protein [Catenulispora rubra]|uniref:hypothetical protein n=1 Tax=Catenulispora rubra TaxID=280293 RepID=UPI001892650F|nr:hypothetical protein [Catenulispora rubra]
MTNEEHGSLPITRGTVPEIIQALSRHGVGLNPLTVATAKRRVLEGNRTVELEGQRFEVIEPEWDIVQDVYGCEDGRDCTSVTAEDRVRFEAIIAARLQAEG